MNVTWKRMLCCNLHIFESVSLSKQPAPGLRCKMLTWARQVRLAPVIWHLGWVEIIIMINDLYHHTGRGENINTRTADGAVALTHLIAHLRLSPAPFWTLLRDSASELARWQVTNQPLLLLPPPSLPPAIPLSSCTHCRPVAFNSVRQKWAGHWEQSFSHGRPSILEVTPGRESHGLGHGGRAPGCRSSWRCVWKGTVLLSAQRTCLASWIRFLQKRLRLFSGLY